MRGAIAASIRSPSWLQSHDIICISSISKATDMEACGEEAKREKWLVVAKVKFVLIAPPGWKFQFSPRFVKLFIRRFNESSRRDTTENSSSDHDLLDESFPSESLC